MTDSTLIFRPGDRITGSDGLPSSGAVLTFFEAGTELALEVFSDAALTVSLGTSVTCDSAGYPSSGGNRTLIYTGSDPFKIVCKDADAVTLWTHDNVAGAVDTSAFVTSVSGAIVYTVTPVSTSGTWTAADVNGVLFLANPGSGTLTRVLPDPADMLGGHVKIRYDGTSSTGLFIVKTAGSVVIRADGYDATRKAIILAQRGDTLELVSDGVGWHATEIGIRRDVRFMVVDALVTSPVTSAAANTAYLINGTPAGGFTILDTVPINGDIVVYDGQSQYQIYRPYEDCGWVVWDKATSKLWQFRDLAWAEITATDTVPGMVLRASQADQEAGTATDKFVTSGRQVYHPSAAKAWFACDGSGVLSASYNVTSVSSLGTGAYVANLTGAFSSANFCVSGSVKPNTGTYSLGSFQAGTKAAGSFAFTTYGIFAAGSNTAVNATAIDMVFYGDQ